jgi:hypothetical protein
MNEYRDGFREVQRDVVWTLPRIFLVALIALVVIYGLGFLATGGDLAIYRFWAPKQANAQRVVFENTQSYVQGKVEYLTRLRFQYQQALIDKEDTRAAGLRTLILDEASTVDNDKLPPDLRAFISRLKE